jgi:hypothetical protein
MLRGLLAMLAATGLVVGSASLTLAQDESSDERSAMEQLEQAAEDGQQAVEAESEEEAKEDSNETFDTPHDSDGD